MAGLVRRKGANVSCRVNSARKPTAAMSIEPGIALRSVSVRIKGIVQGVGFRPFIFQLAKQHELTGWVRNQTDGVEIEAEGLAGHVEDFLRDIPARTPPLARITRMEVSEKPLSSFEHFDILQSHAEESRRTLIPPDVCTCHDCLQELLDPANRRFRYPFINCTNCGPRYSIIKDIPYDRDMTTMAAFVMCPLCWQEYEDPGNRRFHAQPNACWDCGPQVWLEDSSGRTIAQKDEALLEVTNLLVEGAIVAIKGLGGFHLAVDATREPAVARLRKRKIREEKPFAVMFGDLSAVGRYCHVSSEESDLLASHQRPIVLLHGKRELAEPSIAPSVAPRNQLLGAFLPYTPLHYLLFHQTHLGALVMTSGNQSDEPIVTGNNAARKRLEGIADYYLFHDRDVYMRCDDSVTRVIHGMPRPVRRARGYVPVPVFLAERVPEILGVGAELKNTICLTRQNEAFVSQHIGDLENLETLRSFEHTIGHLKRILEIEPKCIVHDLHPDYLCTQWAMDQDGVARLAVQHHHAHIAAVLAERQVSGPVIGVALDGTGYGTDGTIWGGEVLHVDGQDFVRLGHFRQVLLPGGNRAVKEPWRMAVSYLWSLGGIDKLKDYCDLLRRWPGKQVEILLQMLEKRLNSPVTSSCGRLFDAVSALAGLRDTVVYEGQAAIELEQSMLPSDERYVGAVRKEQDMWILDPLPMVAEVIEDVRRGQRVGAISARFHNGLVALLLESIQRVREETGLGKVALSGGVFQNAYLARYLEEELQNLGFDVYTHVEVPTNDACISLGQVYVGAQRLMNEV